MSFAQKLSWIFCTISAICLSSCSSRQESSKLVVNFPAAQSLKAAQQGVSAFSFAWDKACFMVNVTASDIAQRTAKSQCDIPVGVFAGSVAPNGSLSIEVPRGNARTVDIIAYFRSSSSEPCATADSPLPFNFYKSARVARITGVDILEQTVEVNAKVVLPSPGVNLLTQYSLPANCSPFAPSGEGSARVVNGGAAQSGGSGASQIHALSTVSGFSGQTLLSGSGIQMEISRKRSGVE